MVDANNRANCTLFKLISLLTAIVWAIWIRMWQILYVRAHSICLQNQCIAVQTRLRWLVAKSQLTDQARCIQHRIYYRITCFYKIKTKTYRLISFSSLRLNSSPLRNSQIISVAILAYVYFILSRSFFIAKRKKKMMEMIQSIFSVTSGQLLEQVS